MLYVLQGEDAENSLSARQAARPCHLARLQALYDQGRLILADPGPAGFAGSLIVAEFSSQTEAETWLAADPYVTTGVFKRHWACPFKQVFPR